MYEASEKSKGRKIGRQREATVTVSSVVLLLWCLKSHGHLRASRLQEPALTPHRASSFIETTDKLLCILERLLSSHTLRALFCRHGAYKELDAICTIPKIKWWRCQAVENKQIKASQTYPKRVLLLPCWNWNMETQFSPFGSLSCSPLLSLEGEISHRLPPVPPTQPHAVSRTGTHTWPGVLTNTRGLGSLYPHPQQLLRPGSH